jgi:hypothetical protein
MNIGGKVKLDFGNVKCVVAQHSSSLPDGTYGGNPMGFVIESTEGNFYYAGDTALTYDMKLIGDYRSINFAFLPIGDNFTIPETENPYVELYMMTKCNYHIIANSSFSWWGSWLSNSKLTIAPSQWFGSAMGKNTDDVYCKNWIKI